MILVETLAFVIIELRVWFIKMVLKQKNDIVLTVDGSLVFEQI